MAEHKVGDVRPTQLLHTYGVGAMVDLPNIAAMVMGLDDWKLVHAKAVGEERLLRAVRAQLGSRSNASCSRRSSPTRPPAIRWRKIGVPVTPFPQWYRCPCAIWWHRSRPVSSSCGPTPTAPTACATAM